MGKNTFEVTDATFQEEVIKSKTPVLVDFWAEWCGPCKMIAPAVEEIAAKYTGRLRVAKMDVDSSPYTPQMFDIQGIPTLIVFKDGVEAHRIIGFKPKERLEAEIVRFLELQKA